MMLSIQRQIPENRKRGFIVPKGTLPGRSLKRFFSYYREVLEADRIGTSLGSSAHLAKALGVKASQVRKDLNYLNCFGRRGIGYSVDDLKVELSIVLGIGQSWNVALIGVGKLGRALLSYHPFGDSGYHIVAAFDTDPVIVGSDIDGVHVYHVDELASIVASSKVELCLLSVQADVAQEVATAAEVAGVAAIMNFTPVNLQLSDSTCLRTIDLVEQMNVLTFRLRKSQQRGDHS